MPDAESQLATRRAWWRENRPATKDLFDQELAVAIDRIANAPFASTRVRRTTRACHSASPFAEDPVSPVFRDLERQGEVQILAAAGSRQRRVPRIRLQDAP